MRDQCIEQYVIYTFFYMWVQNTSFNYFWVQWQWVKLQEEPLIVAGRQLMSQYDWIPHISWRILNIQYLVSEHVGYEGWILWAAQLAEWIGMITSYSYNVIVYYLWRFPYCMSVGHLGPPTAYWCIPQRRVNNISVNGYLLCTKGFLSTK